MSSSSPPVYFTEPTSIEHAGVHDSDADRLAELGFDQELKRGWGLLQNFGVSFSIISVITGISTLFSFGLNTGGPAVMVWGWVIVCFFTLFVATSMGEIVSAVPTSGGPYHWAASIAPSKHKAFWSYITGWFNLLGQVAVTTGITFGLAGLIAATAAAGTSFDPTPARKIGIHAALLVSHGIINTFGVGTLGILNNVSVTLHSLGIFSFAVAVLAAAPKHQTAKFVFTTFTDNTGGWSERASSAYVAIIGILMAQYTITGFDASAHMSEETHNAARSAPLGVLMSVGVSAIFGFFLILSLLFSIQDYVGTVGSDQPVLQILTDIFGLTGGKVLMCLVLVCVWHCGLFSITSNSRMMYSFARDGGIPRFFAHVDSRNQSPTRAVWLACLLAFLLALPSIGSSVAFSAATSIATIGLYVSYGIPIFLALLYPFVKGPFSLGKLSRPIGIVACLWVLFISVVFCLPTANPVDSQTLNYTPVAVGIILFGSLSFWALFARKTFKGPFNHLVAENKVDPAVVGGLSPEEEAEISKEKKASSGDAVVVKVNTISS